MEQRDSKNNLEKVNQDLLEEAELSDIDTIEEAQEVINSLPDEQKILIARSVTKVSYTGPIPHPDMLKEYNDIDDSFANRILAMAEKDQEHMISRDRQIIKFAGREGTLTLIFSFITIIFLLTLTTLLMFHDKKIESFVVMIPTLAVIIRAYTRQPDKENDK